MLSGILGVPAGSFLAQYLRPRFPSIDAQICGLGLLISTPMVFGACLAASYSSALCFTFVFFGEFFLNLTWSIVADILLVSYNYYYVVGYNEKGEATPAEQIL